MDSGAVSPTRPLMPGQCLPAAALSWILLEQWGHSLSLSQHPCWAPVQLLQGPGCPCHCDSIPCSHKDHPCKLTVGDTGLFLWAGWTLLKRTPSLRISCSDHKPWFPRASIPHLWNDPVWGLFQKRSKLTLWGLGVAEQCRLPPCTSPRPPTLGQPAGRAGIAGAASAATTASLQQWGRNHKEGKHPSWRLRAGHLGPGTQAGDTGVFWPRKHLGSSSPPDVLTSPRKRGVKLAHPCSPLSRCEHLKAQRGCSTCRDPAAQDPSSSSPEVGRTPLHPF